MACGADKEWIARFPMQQSGPDLELAVADHNINGIWLAPMDRVLTL